MLLSRFWYVALALAAAAAAFLMFTSTSVSNRMSGDTMEVLLGNAAVGVESHLRDQSHERAAKLIRLCFDQNVQDTLAAANDAEALDGLKEKRSALRSVLAKYAQEPQNAFEKLWVVDLNGRVLASYGDENHESNAPEYDLGGYALVADALHGHVRDDTWIFNTQLYRVVARPVDKTINDFPIGAVIGANAVSQAFAQKIAEQLKVTVAFFATGTGVADIIRGTPPDAQSAGFDFTIQDVKRAEEDPLYTKGGRTNYMDLQQFNDSKKGFRRQLGAVFSRLPGEAWDLGAGYAVLHSRPVVESPTDFLKLTDESDQGRVPLVFIALGAAGAALLGLVFTILEHTLPLVRFRRSVHVLGQGKEDVLKPGTFRGSYKKIASDMNDALDKVAAKSGVERGPADLESVLGPLPAQPQMSAFSVPKVDEVRERSLPRPPAKTPGPITPAPLSPGSPIALPDAGGGTLPSAGLSDGDKAAVARAMAEAAEPPPDAATPSPPPAAAKGDGERRMIPPRRGGDAAPGPTTPGPGAPRPPVKAAAPAAPTSDGEDEVAQSRTPGTLIGGIAAEPGAPFDEEADWHRVYDDFMALKAQLGEPLDRKLTYDKFRGTLQRNKDALVQRHGCERVQFKVYEKQGKAALKASPVK